MRTEKIAERILEENPSIDEEIARQLALHFVVLTEHQKDFLEKLEIRPEIATSYASDEEFVEWSCPVCDEFLQKDYDQYDPDQLYKCANCGALHRSTP